MDPITLKNFSAKAERRFWEAPDRAHGCLVFGCETEGVPERSLEKLPDRCVSIPMPGSVRSLNLASAVGIVLYEALRQTTGGRLGR
jgi:tRNA (cytidine/uridine-2'-O-)-methyltransferase